MSEEKRELLLDEENGPIITEDECRQLKPIIDDYVHDYARNTDKPVDVWLSRKLQQSFPEKSESEIKQIADEVVTAIRVFDERKSSLARAVAQGRSKESWFAADVSKALSGQSAVQAGEYLKGLDSAVAEANAKLYHTVTTQAGVVSQNPNLDGFIAEQYHVQTFNMNAKANGSQYYAEVIEPNGTTYGKNSVDMVIKDGNGKVVRRYQSKYCKDANATAQAFEHGDYRGQQKLVPEDQQAEIAKKSSTVLEAPDGTTSNALSKERAREMRDEAQSGNFNDLNWNEYQMKDVCKGIAVNVGTATLQGAAIGAGFEIAHKLASGDEISGDEIVKQAVTTGTDFGVKAAAAGALKVGVEKGIVKAIPRGTPMSAITNIAYVAVENAKILSHVVTGKLTVREGVDKMASTTISSSAGLFAMGKGTAAGASLGAVLGPVGVAVGGFIGGTVGYIAGSKVGETVYNGAKKVVSTVKSAVKTVCEGAKTIVHSIGSGIKNIGRKLMSFLGF